MEACKIEIVAFFKLVIREFVADRYTKSIRSAGIVDYIDAGEFCFFAAVLGMTWNLNRIKGRAEQGAVALCRTTRAGNSDLTLLGAPPFNTPLEHAHTVCHSFRMINLLGKMHSLPLLSAPDMSKASSRD